MITYMESNNISHWWHVYSRNKRSLSLNIKTKQGTEILKKLISTADVLLKILFLVL